MRKGLMLAAALMMLVGSMVPMQAAGAEVTYAAQGPVVELSLYSTVESDADLATITIGIAEKGATSQAALQAATVKAEAVLAVIKPYADSPDDLELQDISVRELYDWEDDKKVSLGFGASARYSIKVRDFDKINGLLAAATKAGAASVDGPNFDLESKANAEAQARKQGLDTLMMRGRAIAQSAGYSDAKLIWYSEEIEMTEVAYAEAAVAEAADASAEEPEPKLEIMPGKITTSVQLKATFEMVKN